MTELRSLHSFLRLARLNLRVDHGFHKMQARTRPAWRSWWGCIAVAWKDAHRG